MRIPFTNIEIRTSTPLNNFLKGHWQEITSTKAGVSITKDNAMSISGVYSAVRVYSDAIASLPIKLIKDTGKFRFNDKTNPLYKLVNREPNQLMTSFVFRQIIIPHILLWGNSISIIEFYKKSKRPKSIIPVHPSKVKIEIKGGIAYYTIKVKKDKEITLDQSNILHFRGLGDEIIGLSVIDYAKESLGLGKAAEQFGSTFFGNGANMNGALQTDQTLSDKAYDNLKKSIDKRHKGIDKANKMLILEQGLKFVNTSIPPDAAQFLETRKFSITEIARWFKLPPHVLADLERATFTNIEQQDLNFVKHSILPFVINMEQELNRKLLREIEKDTFYFRMNLDGLLRGDIKTRSEAYRIFINNGVMSPNEARKKEEMNPYKGGGSRFMPLNLAPIDETGTNQQQQQKTTK